MYQNMEEIQWQVSILCFGEEVTGLFPKEGQIHILRWVFCTKWLQVTSETHLSI